MSSFVYGTVTAQRTAAPATKSKTAVPPGMGTYLDTLTALVPAEALALYEGIVLPNTTKTVAGKTIISHSSLLVWSCAALLVLSSVLYLIGRKRQQLGPLDVPRLLIPPAALVAWMLVQAPGVWNIWWPGSNTAERVVIAAFAAVALGILAKSLGNVADKAPGALVVTDINPKTGSTAGGEKITLAGKGFTGAIRVSFGQVIAPQVDASSDTELTTTSPAHAEGAVDVKVTTASGTSTASTADRFTYVKDGADVHPKGGPEPEPVPPDGGPAAVHPNGVPADGSQDGGAAAVHPNGGPEAGEPGGEPSADLPAAGQAADDPAAHPGGDMDPADTEQGQ
jgi:IPT/TIG domain